jgi:hypothetical protein
MVRNLAAASSMASGIPSSALQTHAKHPDLHLADFAMGDWQASDC